jgi:hypothetical protein
MRLRAAAHRALRAYPGPIGQLLCREISNWEEHGYRLGGRGLIGAIVDQIMQTPLPEPAAMPSADQRPGTPLPATP